MVRLYKEAINKYSDEIEDEEIELPDEIENTEVEENGNDNVSVDDLPF